ncbi:Protein-lysine N-methyltransferase efm4 [Coemansia sp. RSA 1836]|nr:Protein-lysine N-methyltransferase efm4 [Coemansia sp. RSA 2052]KAJ2582883.1 Protein-lysine N-methyltransferase efm4 [Coemansia sp. RSA 1836]
MSATANPDLPDDERERLRVQLLSDKAHHLKNGRFGNPWPSFTEVPPLTFYRHLLTRDTSAAKQSIAEGRAPRVVPLDRTMLDNKHADDLQLTWLGHSSVLIQLDYATILCDPVFSSRCSPVQWLGPKRYTSAPCQVKDLPEGIDFLVISHNHHDHLDYNTLCEVAARYPAIQVFAPLGNKQILEAAGFNIVYVKDWWEEEEAKVTTLGKDGQLAYKFACTPAQHITSRGVFDLNKTLWSSWVIVGPSGRRVFFSGDTAYSSAFENESGAVCPAFKQIGQVYGPIDLAALAVGGYGPETFFCGVNSKPEHAVRIHEDIGARKSVPIHWGTFMLTSEPVDEPPVRFAREMSARGHLDHEFSVLSIGETAPGPSLSGPVDVYPSQTTWSSK